LGSNSSFGALLHGQKAPIFSDLQKIHLFLTRDCDPRKYNKK